jgi:nitrogen fixation NifU-like protein
VSDSGRGTRPAAAPQGYGAGAIEHFTAPRNVGAVDSPDGRGSDANPACGDRTTITVRIADDRVAEARFRTFGCTAAIASASAVTELATGRTVQEAAELAAADVLNALGGLPAHKEACALMAIGALRSALVDARVAR